MAYAFLLRASEIWAGGIHAVRRKHLSFALGSSWLPDDRAALADRVFLTIETSKNGTPGRSVCLAHNDHNTLRSGHPNVLGPWALWSAKQIVTLAPDLPAHALLAAYGREPHEAWTYTQAMAALRDAAIATDTVPHAAFSRISTHSLRIGADTDMARAGLPEAEERLAGRWNSESNRVYRRPDPLLDTV